MQFAVQPYLVDLGVCGAEDVDLGWLAELRKTRCFSGEQRVRRRMNIELNFPPNFEGLVLGCIDADFCK